MALTHLVRLALVGSLVTVGLALAPAASARPDGCRPTTANRPVCPAEAEASLASFLDPTAVLQRPDQIVLRPQVYVAPFAELDARGGPIRIGRSSNVQDNVRVIADGGAPSEAIARAGLTRGAGVRIGVRVIMAHGSTVKGPARLGLGPVIQVPDGHGGTTEDSGVFISFSAEVDGAVVERDSGLSALSRVGPGVRLKSGRIVLPGKDVLTQRQADDPRLGFVRPVTEADREFNHAVVEVNRGLAREYTELARDGLSNVRGINVDPGGNEFDEERDLPRVESDLCTGPEARDPAFRNRIIGDSCFEDTRAALDAKMGRGISIRADEGGPFGIGTIESMGDRVIFHALEGSDLRVGDRVTYGDRVVVHGGGRPQFNPTTGLAAPTIIGNDVVLGDQSIVFRSLVRNSAVLGRRSLVVGSELEVGQRIPPRTVYVNDEVAGRVEW